MKNKIIFILFFINLIVIPSNAIVDNGWIDVANSGGLHERKIGVTTHFNSSLNQWVEGSRPIIMSGKSVVDSNNYIWTQQSDGLYKVEYEGKITYFGFGISGLYNGNSFKKLSTDFSWALNDVNTTTEGYNISLTTTNSGFNKAWYTNISFGKRTKITNKITNTLSYPITSGKFWYIFTLNEGDTVKYDYLTYETNADNVGNLNYLNKNIILNGKLLFNFDDIVDSGFDITDFHIINASSLGFNYDKRIVTIGFTKGDGILQVGESIIVDPTIKNNSTSNKDSYINSASLNTNYGSSTTLNIYRECLTGCPIGTTYSNATLQFPINLPSDTTSIINATLWVYNAGGGRNNPMYISNITSSWTENGITWNTKPTWTGQVGTITINGVGWFSSSITSSVRGWWDGSLTNNGIIIYGLNDEAGAIDIYSQEGTYPPFITIWYATNSPPTVPVLTTHANYHNSSTTTVSFTGSTDPEGNSISYRVKVGTSSGADNILNETITGTTSSNFNVIPSNSYYWSVYAFDSLGASSGWAVESSFTFTNNAPSIPTITYPLNNTLNYTNITTYMNWSNSTDIDGDPTNYINYTWQFSNTSDFSNILNTSTTANNYSSIIGYNLGSYYYMRVKANDNWTSSEWSSIIHLTSGISLIQLTPLNTSTGNSNYIKLTWKEYPLGTYTYQLALDSTFTNIITSGVTNNLYTDFLNLNTNTLYYWHVKNATGNYLSTFYFTTSPTSLIPGSLNITVKDEQTLATINNFTAQVYNSTYFLTKNSTNGWANFTSSEVISGEYFIRIVPAAQTTISTTTTTTTTQSEYVVNTTGGNTTYPNISSSSSTTTTTTQSSTGYATRFVLATSPTNVTVYLPSMANTIDTVAFYLLDYSSSYPYSTSKISIRKNNSVMQSSYFDAEAKIVAYLIRGDNYGITVTNGNNINNWGNYMSTSSGNAQIVITNIAVNATSTQPFNYNLSHTNSDITLSWIANETIISLNFTILKNNTELVHQIITTVLQGQSSYIVTDLNATYYVYMTEQGSLYKDYRVFNYQSGILRANCGLGLGCIIGWGSGSTRYDLPAWMYNNASMFIVWILAGSFGALFAGFGAIISLILIALFTFWGWLNITTLIGSIVILVIIDYIRSRE